MLEFQIVSKDARGEIYVLKNNGVEIANLDGFIAGVPRGGHYHQNSESKTVVYGELEYLMCNPKNIDTEIRKRCRKGDTIQIPSGLAHIFIAETDALLFGIRNGEFEATKFPPYRKIVDDFLSKHK